MSARREAIAAALYHARYGTDMAWDLAPRGVRVALLFDADVVLEDLHDDFLLADTCDLDTLNENHLLRVALSEVQKQAELASEASWRWSLGTIAALARDVLTDEAAARELSDSASVAGAQAFREVEK